MLKQAQMVCNGLKQMGQNRPKWAEMGFHEKVIGCHRL